MLVKCFITILGTCQQLMVARGIEKLTLEPSISVTAHILQKYILHTRYV